MNPLEKIVSLVTFVFDSVYRLLLEYSKLVLLVIVFIVSAQVFSRKFFGTSIRFYSQKTLWPWILLIVKIWKDTGYGTIVYLASITGIDTSLYEAADVDGATFWQKVTNITLPDRKSVV